MQFKVEKVCDCDIFRALSDPNRVRLLSCLAESGEGCAMGEVAECCSVDLSVVSRHLSILRSAGLVRSEKEGRKVIYEINRQSLAGVLRALADCIESGCEC